MKRLDRHAAIRSALTARADVPCAREMARTIGAGWRAVARDYHALGIKCSRGPGRPPGRSMPVESLIPTPIYDAYCRVAIRTKRPLTHVIRAALIAHARDTISTGSLSQR